MEKIITLSTSLVLVGAILGIPSVLLEFPGNLLTLPLPLLCIEAIHKIEKESDRIFGVLSRALFCTAPWVGFAVAFHLRYGEWDGQGIWIAVVASPLSFGFLIFRSRISRSTPEPEIEANKSIEEQPIQPPRD